MGKSSTEEQPKLSLLPILTVQNLFKSPTFQLFRTKEVNKQNKKKTFLYIHLDKYYCIRVQYLNLYLTGQSLLFQQLKYLNLGIELALYFGSFNYLRT
jgi:hypothetical protein